MVISNKIRITWRGLFCDKKGSFFLWWQHFLGLILSGLFTEMLQWTGGRRGHALAMSNIHVALVSVRSWRPCCSRPRSSFVSGPLSAAAGPACSRSSLPTPTTATVTRPRMENDLNGPWVAGAAANVHSPFNEWTVSLSSEMGRVVGWASCSGRALSVCLSASRPPRSPSVSPLCSGRQASGPCLLLLLLLLRPPAAGIGRPSSGKPRPFLLMMLLLLLLCVGGSSYTSGP